MMAGIRRSLVLALFGVLFAVPGAQAQTMVDLELALLVDVSGSVDATEYNLQRAGYAQAFQNPALWTAISQGTLGRIAVTYIEWSGSGQASPRVSWTLIDSQAAAIAFGNAIALATRAYSGLTGVGYAIQYGTNSVLGNQFTSARQVLDVSGDGCTNSGVSASVGRAYALANGIDAINGLVIQPNNGCTVAQGGNVLNYYTSQVITTNGFVQVANDFADFGAAVDRKIIREVQGTVPEPISMVLMGTGLSGVAMLRRRRRKAEELEKNE